MPLGHLMLQGDILSPPILHQMGFTIPKCCHNGKRSLIASLFTLTFAGGIVSVALSLVLLRRVAVSNHSSLWCSDFPLYKRAIAQSA